MIKVYVMATCPDCFRVKAQLANNPDYRLVDIGEHVRNLKEFMRLRDRHPAFHEIKAKGQIGIPCFVDDAGNVMFDMDEATAHATRGIGTDATLPTDEIEEGAMCSIDGKGC